MNRLRQNTLQKGERMVGRIRTVRAASLALCLLTAIGGAQGQYTALSFTALEIDSLYPGVCNKDGCFPSVTRYTDDNGVNRGQLGFTGGTYVAWPARTFPGNPLGFVVRYATPHTDLQVDFYLDGMDGEGTTYLWFCQLPKNSDVWSPVLWSDTCWIDYSLLPAGASYSGSHRLFFSQTCGGPGCGDFEEIVILFGADDAGVVKGRNAEHRPAPDASRPLLVNLASRANSLSLREGMAAYDVHGRRVSAVRSAAGGVVVLGSVKK